MKLRQKSLWIAVAALVVGPGMSLVAAADTIYLKNGRVLHTAEAKVVGDRVELTQHGARQAIPRSLVERIIEDERRGPGDRRPPLADGSARRNSDLRPPPQPAAPCRPIDLGLPVNVAPRGGSGSSSGPTEPRTLAGLVAPGDVQALLSGGLPMILGQLGAMSSGALEPGPGAETLDLEKIPAVLPLVGRLAALLSARNPSAEAATELGRELLQGLREVGLSDEMIRAKALEWGIDLDALGAGAAASR